ncbi:MAG: hypothetical protein HUU60_04975 [Armatimonadetes bacterium]|nr:hypothetical protein [Armatimonadota bacterium]
MKRNGSITLLVVLLLSGCQKDSTETTATTDDSARTTTTAPASTEATGSTDSSTPATATEATEVKAGMDMAEVKKLRGAPKEAKHEHGPGGAEIDIWVYEDREVRFEGGKVVDRPK